MVTVSPTAVIVYVENIGFIYPAMSMMVIGPSLPLLRQSRWSLLYDVYWLQMIMLNNGYLNRYRVTGNCQWDRNTWTRFRIRIALSLLNNIIKINESKTNNQTMNKINERLIMNKSTNNESRIMTNWHKHLYNIYILRVPLFIKASLNVTVLVLHRVKTSLWFQN
jgi:hypothetical protein